MKKTQNKANITLFFFLKVTTLHIKKSWKKNTFLALTYIQKQRFFIILKTNDYINYSAKFVEQHYSKTHFDASESA
jgi:hypothetical protein